MKASWVFAGTVAALFGASAQAQTASAERQRKAYDYALRCFVADGRTDEAGAKLAFDAVMKLGRLQGFSDRTINEDFADAIARENIKFARSDAYKQRVLSECRSLGMAS